MKKYYLNLDTQQMIKKTLLPIDFDENKWVIIKDKKLLKILNSQIKIESKFYINNITNNKAPHPEPVSNLDSL